MSSWGDLQAAADGIADTFRDMCEDTPVLEGKPSVDCDICSETLGLAAKWFKDSDLQPPKAVLAGPGVLNAETRKNIAVALGIEVAIAETGLLRPGYWVVVGNGGAWYSRGA